MKDLNNGTVGVQEKVCTFTQSMCNFEAILACIFYKCRSRFPSNQEMMNFLTYAMLNRSRLSLDTDAYVNDSSDLIKGILKVSYVETERISNLDQNEIYDKGVCVGCFRKGSDYHFNVIDFKSAKVFKVLYDGYKSSNIVKYGELHSVRVYDKVNS